jgi:hypothetical protein
MVLNPLQRLSLIKNTSVQTSIRLYLLPRQETKTPDAIVVCDDDGVHRGGLDELRPVEVGIRERVEAASRDFEHDRELGLRRRFRRRVDVEEQTVLGVTGLWEGCICAKTQIAVLVNPSQ